MNRYMVGIIEDEVPSMELMLTLLDRIPFVEVVFTARTVEEAHRELKQYRPDILFCDVELPDGNCFELLDSLDELPEAICIVTSYNHYAIHAIKRGVVDYILKPLDLDELTEALERMVHHLGKIQPTDPKAKNNILINDFRGCRILNESEIVYLKSDNRYTQVFLNDGEHVLTNYTLSRFEEKLSNRFMRIHKSYVANLSHIVKLEGGRGGDAILTTGSTIPVAYRRKSLLRKALD